MIIQLPVKEKHVCKCLKQGDFHTRVLETKEQKDNLQRRINEADK